ncbi:ATP-binding cassette domain-containing protein [Agathobaculum sp. TL06]
MKQELIQLYSIYCCNQGIPALQGLSLSLFQGELIQILGLPGCGKTMTAKVIAGVTPYHSGGYWMDGTPVRINNIQQAQKKGIFMIGPESALVGSWSVGENLLLPCYRKSVFSDSEKLNAYAQKILDDYGFPCPACMPATTLSEPARIMLELCRAVYSKARLIVFDQVLSFFNPQQRSELVSKIKSYCNTGLSVVLLECADFLPPGLADRVLLMRDGQIAMEYLRNEYDPSIGASILNRWLQAHTDAPCPPQPLLKGKPLLQLSKARCVSLDPTILYQGEVIGLCSEEAAKAIAGKSTNAIFVQPYRLPLSPAQYAKWAAEHIAWIDQNYIDWGSVEKMSVLDCFVCHALGHRKYFIADKFCHFIYDEWGKLLDLSPMQWQQPVYQLAPRDRLKVRLYQMMARAIPALILDIPQSEYQKTFYREISVFLHWAAMHGKLILLTPQTTAWLSCQCTRFVPDSACISCPNQTSYSCKFCNPLNE